jgi:nucleoside phosphorylase
MSVSSSLGLSCPRRFDFVLIVTTTQEKQAVEDVMGLTQGGDIPDFKYAWGYVKERGTSVAAALVFLDDVTGRTRAATETKKAVEYLAPDNILLVGTAGGIKRKNARLTPGDLVISSYVHTGPLDNNPAIFNPLRHSRILPPSDFLYDIAIEVGKQFKKEHLLCGDRLNFVHPTKGLRSCRLRSHRQILHDKHIISCDALQESEYDPTLKKLVRSFPRFVAYEMEAGGVAEALWESWQKQKAPGYLVIKGISDILEFPRVRKGKQRQSSAESSSAHKIQREKDTPKAARAAAMFARRLMIKAVGQQRDDGSRRPTPISRLLPRGQSVVINDNVSGVVHEVTPQDYSQAAAANLRALVEEPGPPGNKKIFTVCAFEPRDLWNVLAQRLSQNGKQNGCPQVCDLVKEAERSFPHFKLFSDFARVQHSRCVRVLLLADSHWTKRLENPEQWTLFEKLNGDVKCWGVNRNDLLPDITFLTDYCVVGENLILDYYPDSSTLVVSEVYGAKVDAVLLGLKKKFENEKDKFIEWKDLCGQVKDRFPSEAVPEQTI